MEISEGVGTKSTGSRRRNIRRRTRRSRGGGRRRKRKKVDDVERKGIRGLFCWLLNVPATG